MTEAKRFKDDTQGSDFTNWGHRHRAIGVVGCSLGAGQVWGESDGFSLGHVEFEMPELSTENSLRVGFKATVYLSHSNSQHRPCLIAGKHI